MFSRAVLIGLLTGLVMTASAQDLRDPTRPYGESAPRKSATAPLKVSAIFVSDSRRVAIVNGRSLSVGDSFAGATVSRIDQDAVTFNFAGRAVTARLARTKIRQ